MRVAGIVQDSIVDGPGLRFVVFAQGCKHECPGCQNPDTWDPSGGTELAADEIIRQMLSNPLTDGVTLSGGEPLLQVADCAKIAEVARQNGLNVWLYTGFLFEELTKMAQSDSNADKLIKTVDVIVDGLFEIQNKTFSLKWRGSRNQRIIDVPCSLRAGTTVLQSTGGEGYE